MSTKPTPSKPLFLYVGEMQKAELSKVVQAGYVPISVPSFDAVKIIVPSQVALDCVARAAFETIRATGSDIPREEFGLLVSTAMAKL